MHGRVFRAEVSPAGHVLLCQDTSCFTGCSAYKPALVLAYLCCPAGLYQDAVDQPVLHRLTGWLLSGHVHAVVS